MCVSRLQSLRFAIVILGIGNIVVVIVGVAIICIGFPSCDSHEVIPILLLSVAAALKIATLIKSGIAQAATARTILNSNAETIIRHETRMRYKTWLWWTRFVIVITLFQFLGATYLLFNIAKHASANETNCLLGVTSNNGMWNTRLLVLFTIMSCFVVILHCFIGSDVLEWRSFYATKDDVWKAHYQEVFDHGIREIMCCLGRAQYLDASEEDEVYSVARLLGDLVAYRASGTGHLELLAGLTLLQRHSQSPRSYEGFVEAPKEQLQEAAAFYKFAEAAYTGPLLDVGRNIVLFPCAWLYRQGVLTPWNRNSRPKLAGDNWWRGHAAAFLKYINLSQDVLRQGRVCQEKCKAAYFVLVLHDIRSVVIAVRGTESPEDLITDGLGRECLLSAEDLDGLINSSHVHPDVKLSVESSFPHHGHLGVAEAARELFMQVEGSPRHGDGVATTGLLSSLLGAGCECDGYNIRIVGHSLGGAVATLLGLRLYSRFPRLHVYTYGALPCVDLMVSNACAEFVTSIVYDNEFSARLSVGSILRLRAAAIMALSQDTNTETTLISRLARRFISIGNHERSKIEVKDPAEHPCEISTADDQNHHIYEGSMKPEGEFPLCSQTDSREYVEETDEDLITAMDDFGDGLNTSDPVADFMETVPRSENGSAGDPTEMFLAGLVIHILPVPHQQTNINMPLWRSWTTGDRGPNYKAYIVNRESFTDMVVSPSMFLDHLPWRCFHAMQKILEAQSRQDVHDESEMV